MRLENRFVGRAAGLALAALSLGVLSVMSGCQDVGESSAEGANRKTEALPFLNLAENVEYVGQEACRQCHFEEYSTYVQTGMGRSMYLMSPEEVVEDFSDVNEIVVEGSGLTYRMVERDGRYFQQQFMRDSRGREIAADEHELIWVIGSNNHSRSYVTVTDDKLFQAPICWYPQPSKWELCPGYEFKNDHFAREINISCLHCHNGKMETVAGERNKFHDPIPHGIGCERCHGPGQLHVERWTGGTDTPTGEVDHTIVNPRALPREERLEVCFQCHLGSAKATERVARYDREMDAFRPGQQITEAVVPLHYVSQTKAEFGLSAQADRMILSRCFKESGGKLECLTCHNPHVTVYHEDRPEGFFNQRCMNCHQTDSCVAPAAARQATDPVDDCVGCHMRYADPDDQRFTQFTDHWIRRDITVEAIDERESYEVKPVFADRFASFSPGEQEYYEGRAVWLLARDAPSSIRPEMWAAAQGNFERAIDKGFERVEAWFYLGKVRRQRGDKQGAMKAFAKANEVDPAHADAAFALGQAWVAQNELARGAAVFEEMIRQDPDNTMALAEAGRTYSMMKRPAEALTYFDRAIAREPWTPSLHTNRGKVLAGLGRFDEAIEAAKNAVRLDPDEPGVWDFYEKVHQAVGQHAQAQEGRRLVQLLSEASGSGPRYATTSP